MVKCRGKHVFRMVFVMLCALMALTACGTDDKNQPTTHVVDLGDLFTERQEQHLTQIIPSHSGDTYILTQRGFTPDSVAADQLIRTVIDECSADTPCEDTGIFLLVSEKGPPQLRFGPAWSQDALIAELNYGPRYLQMQRRNATLAPLRQAKDLAPQVSKAIATSDSDYFLSSLVNDEIGDALSPDYGIGTGLFSRARRAVATATANLFHRNSGPIEAVVGFLLIGLVVRVLLRRARGWGGAFARVGFTFTYALLSVPVAHGVITLLGYRAEDRFAYPMPREQLAFFFDADLWSPIDDLKVIAVVGGAFLVATAIEVFSMVVLLAISDDPKKIDRLSKDSQLFALMVSSSPDEVGKAILRRVAFAIVLVWAAYAFLPALIAALLIIPSLLYLPWSFRDALRWYRFTRVA